MIFSLCYLLLSAHEHRSLKSGQLKIDFSHMHHLCEHLCDYCQIYIYQLIIEFFCKTYCKVLLCIYIKHCLSTCKVCIGWCQRFSDEQRWDVPVDPNFWVICLKTFNWSCLICLGRLKPCFLKEESLSSLLYKGGVKKNSRECKFQCIWNFIKVLNDETFLKFSLHSAHLSAVIFYPTILNQPSVEQKPCHRPTGPLYHCRVQHWQMDISWQHQFWRDVT